MKALKTYNQYHTDCLIAEGKLKEAERLEERHTGKSAELGLGQSGGQRRSSVKKMERLMEKVSVCVWCKCLAGSLKRGFPVVCLSVYKLHSSVNSLYGV